MNDVTNPRGLLSFLTKLKNAPPWATLVVGLIFGCSLGATLCWVILHNQLDYYRERLKQEDFSIVYTDYQFKVDTLKKELVDLQSQRQALQAESDSLDKVLVPIRILTNAYKGLMASLFECSIVYKDTMMVLVDTTATPDRKQRVIKFLEVTMDKAMRDSVTNRTGVPFDTVTAVLERSEFGEFFKSLGTQFSSIIEAATPRLPPRQQIKNRPKS